MRAGAAAVEITPRTPHFLFGYPHVHRISEGVHDPLYASALYLDDGDAAMLTIACDVIYIDRALAGRVRRKIEAVTDVQAEAVIVTATHTHSGPVTVNTASSAGDPVVPPADPVYLRQLEEGIVAAARAACCQAQEATLGLALADGSSVGGNRHDPAGPSLPMVPVLAVRHRRSESLIALMSVCSMHPTVLHEDSRQVSSDFPGMTRGYLQSHLLDEGQPVIWHTGVCGNQSPRHVTQANTFTEAHRLGRLLGRSIEEAVARIDYVEQAPIRLARTSVELPAREFPSVADAQVLLDRTRRRLNKLRSDRADSRHVRTAECDLFGAEETLTLSRMAESGALAERVRSCLPAEITVFAIGPWKFACWPGEVFVEFALDVRKSHPDCHLISLANGELQGYLVTRRAVEQQTYEALNAVFASPTAGEVLVDHTVELLNRL